MQHARYSSGKRNARCYSWRSTLGRVWALSSKATDGNWQCGKECPAVRWCARSGTESRTCLVTPGRRVHRVRGQAALRSPHKRVLGVLVTL